MWGKRVFVRERERRLLVRKKCSSSLFEIGHTYISMYGLGDALLGVLEAPRVRLEAPS